MKSFSILSDVKVLSDSGWCKPEPGLNVYCLKDKVLCKSKIEKLETSSDVTFNDFVPPACVQYKEPDQNSYLAVLYGLYLRCGLLEDNKVLLPVHDLSYNTKEQLLQNIKNLVTFRIVQSIVVYRFDADQFEQVNKNSFHWLKLLDDVFLLELLKGLIAENIDNEDEIEFEIPDHLINIVLAVTSLLGYIGCIRYISKFKLYYGVFNKNLDIVFGKLKSEQEMKLDADNVCVKFKNRAGFIT